MQFTMPDPLIRLTLMGMQNRAGKTRLAKYYIPMEDSEKHALEHEVHKLIASRDPKFTNFVEVHIRNQLLCCIQASWCAVVQTPLPLSRCICISYVATRYSTRASKILDAFLKHHRKGVTAAPLHVVMPTNMGWLLPGL